jgi:hypothetical protein
VEAKMIAHRAHDQVSSFGVIDQGSEEELFFFVEMTDGAPEVEVDEIVSEVPSLRLVGQLGDVLKPARLRKRMVVVVGKRYEAFVASAHVISSHEARATDYGARKSTTLFVKTSVAVSIATCC